MPRQLSGQLLLLHPQHLHTKSWSSGPRAEPIAIPIAPDPSPGPYSYHNNKYFMKLSATNNLKLQQADQKHKGAATAASWRICWLQLQLWLRLRLGLGLWLHNGRCPGKRLLVGVNSNYWARNAESLKSRSLTAFIKHKFMAILTLRMLPKINSNACMRASFGAATGAAVGAGTEAVAGINGAAIARRLHLSMH